MFGSSGPVVMFISKCGFDFDGYNEKLMFFISLIKAPHRILFAVDIKLFTLPVPLNWTIFFFNNGLSLGTTFSKVEEEFELIFFTFVSQMADDANHTTDNNTNLLKPLPVLVGFLFKFTS